MWTQAHAVLDEKGVDATRLVPESVLRALVWLTHHDDVSIRWIWLALVLLFVLALTARRLRRRQDASNAAIAADEGGQDLPPSC